MNINRILEVTFTLIILYLVLSNAGEFSTVTDSIADAYVSSVRALQGR